MGRVVAGVSCNGAIKRNPEGPSQDRVGVYHFGLPEG